MRGELKKRAESISEGHELEREQPLEPTDRVDEEFQEQDQEEVWEYGLNTCGVYLT